MVAAGLYPVQDMISREEPQCVLRVYRDPRRAAEYESTVRLTSRPYRAV